MSYLAISIPTFVVTGFFVSCCKTPSSTGALLEAMSFNCCNWFLWTGSRMSYLVISTPTFVVTGFFVSCCKTPSSTGALPEAMSSIAVIGFCGLVLE